MYFNRDIYRFEVDRMLNHPRAINVFIIILLVCAIAMIAIAYQHDTYFYAFDVKELAKMDTWFRIFSYILIITGALFAFWPSLSILFAACCAIIPPVTQKIDERIKKEGDRPVQSATFDKVALKALFSDSFPEDKFEDFYKTLCNNQPLLNIVDIGKLAEIIMYHSPYCSESPKYKKKREGKVVGNFRPYCKDFYSATGVHSSSFDHNYFSKSQQNVINMFREIIDYDSMGK